MWLSFHIQQIRKKISGIILFPGPWNQCGYVLLDTLNLLSLPLITIAQDSSKNIIEVENYNNNNLYIAVEEAIYSLIKKISPITKED